MGGEALGIVVGVERCVSEGSFGAEETEGEARCCC
jgi:hypothetical protein